jgi:Arc/MetJ-type ribon-helix-helix transcriptional regulator
VPVSVEISGLLERRLRRLVDLGLYSSVSEAVRDAIRMLFERLDLKSLALELYTR